MWKHYQGNAVMLKENFFLSGLCLIATAFQRYNKKKRLHMKEDELFFAEEFCFFPAFNKRETTHRLVWPDTEQWQVKINLLIPDQKSANVRVSTLLK